MDRVFIYITLGVEITDAINVKAIDPGSVTFIKKVRQSTSIPVAAGLEFPPLPMSGSSRIRWI
jgi:hypothetical protein